MELKPETRAVLVLMTHRCAGLCQQLTFQSSVTKRLALSALAESEQPFELEFRLRPVTLRLLEHPSGSRRIIDQLINNLPALLWVQLGEQLIEHERALLDNFGLFKVDTYRDKPSVRFTPSDALLLRSKPDWYHSPDPTQDLAIQTAQSALFTVLDDFLVENAGAGPAEESYAAVNRLMLELIGRTFPHLINLMREYLPGQTITEADPFYYQPQALSYLTYLAFVLSFGLVLNSADTIVVETVGTFSREYDIVEFEASKSFLNFLTSNLPTPDHA